MACSASTCSGSTGSCRRQVGKCAEAVFRLVPWQVAAPHLLRRRQNTCIRFCTSHKLMFAFASLWHVSCEDITTPEAQIES